MLVDHALAALVMAADPTAAEAPAFIVLDFAGGDVHYTPGALSDPDARTTPFSECEGTWPVYGDPAQEAEILDRVRSIFADFHVVVSEDAPVEGPYLRALAGPSGGCGHGVGYAEESCDRTLGHGVVFAKVGAADHLGVVQEAAIIAHELGHAYGLAHVDNEDDIMNPTVGDGIKTFVDTCNLLAGTGGDSCQLVGHCPRGQNSHFGLLSILGPAPVDDLDPAPMQEQGCAVTSRSRRPAHLLCWLILVGFRRR